MKYRYVILFILLFLALLVRCGYGLTPQEKLAHAIAMTEGAYIPGTIPNRYHNPGDLKIMRNGQKYPGQVGVGKADHVIFKNKQAGWNALLHQIDKIIDGTSEYYTTDMTVKQMGKKYAQRSHMWSNNLAKHLGVTSQTTIGEILEVPPRVQYQFNTQEITWLMKEGK